MRVSENVIMPRPSAIRTFVREDSPFFEPSSAGGFSFPERSSSDAISTFMLTGVLARVNLLYGWLQS